MHTSRFRFANLIENIYRVGQRAFHFTCLPFSLSSAPLIFTKTLRPVAAKLRELGVRLVTYLDDNLVIANTPEQAADHTSALIYTLENLGFVIHPEKSMTQPTQGVEDNLNERNVPTHRENDRSHTSDPPAPLFYQTLQRDVSWALV